MTYHPLLKPRTIDLSTAIITVLLCLLAAPGIAVFSFLVW
jgi:hypothetical protein